MSKKARKPSKDDVRDAAKGRWIQILGSLCGLTSDQLDPKKHQPCPKCPDGGDDRFRAFDDVNETGGLFCNQCHSDNNSDGFASLQWLLGIKFTEAVDRVAEHLGMNSARPIDPAESLEFTPWSSELVAFFCQAKPPITEQAFLDVGAKHAMHYGVKVLALPVYDDSLISDQFDPEKTAAWALLGWRGGEQVPKYENGERTLAKSKLTAGSKASGLVGLHGAMRLKTAGLPELVWKVEGLTDLLALQSVIPEHLRDRHLVVTNSKGSKETPKWQAALLGTVNCNVIHDADEPGQAGAKKWTDAIAAQAGDGVEVRNVQLPYEITGSKGKDLRDWLAEGNSYADLLALADATAVATVKRTSEGEIDYTQARYPVQELILKKLQLEVLYEDEEGRVRVFSLLLRKSSTIREVARLKHETLIQICGPPAVEHIVQSANDAGENQWTMADVRKALSLLSSNRRGKNDERGVGVWQGLDEWGNETDTIVLVGNSEGARWNGDKVLRKIVAPRADGLVLDFGATTKEWYDFPTLERNLAEAADIEWRRKQIDQAKEIFSQWNWQHPEIDPTLITGLVMATWVQTIFEWRPLIAVKGESHSGKSTLFKSIAGDQNQRGLLGNLVYAPDQSSEPGIRQHIGNTAIAVLLDELEKSRDRDRILQMLRSSTRGGTISKGTGGAQKGTDFTIRHIVWTSATEAGLHKQPDINRYIQFELLVSKKGAPKIKLPDGRVLFDLGQRLLAIAIRCGIEAKKLAVAMKSAEVPGIDARSIESYSVPAAMLAVSEGCGEEVARALLEKLLGNVDQTEQGRTDQEELLNDILTASIHLDGRTGVKTVSQVLESPGLRVDYAARLEAAGVRLLDDYSVFIAPKLVSQQLLKGTTWDGLRIDQILLRLPGSTKRPMRLAGRTTRGLVVPAAVAAITEAPAGF